MREFALITAYKFILENHLATLPMDPILTALQNGFKVFTYAQFSQIVNKSTAYLVVQYDRRGFTFWSSRDRCYVICYNPRQSPGSTRWTLAHEMGHIYMNHVSKFSPRARYGVENPLFEAEAQEFARFLSFVRLLSCSFVTSWGRRIFKVFAASPKRKPNS